MSSAGEFSFSIKAYDKASGVMRKALELLEQYKKGVQDFGKQASKTSEVIPTMFKKAEDSTKSLEQTSKRASYTITNAYDDVSKAFAECATAIAGVGIALKGINAFGVEAVKTAQDTQLTALRISWMSEALNYNGQCGAEASEEIEKFKKTLSSMSPKMTETTYELVQQGHNVAWVTKNYEMMNDMALMTGKSIDSINDVLGGSYKELREFGIDTDAVKDASAQVLAKEIQAQYQALNGGATMAYSVALAEARTQIYAAELEKFKSHVDEFNNTYEGALERFEQSLSSFKNSVGKIYANILAPLISFGTKVLDFIAGNPILSHIAAIGIAASVAFVAILTSLSLVSKSLGVIIGNFSIMTKSLKSLKTLLSFKNVKQDLQMIKGLTGQESLEVLNAMRSYEKKAIAEGKDAAALGANAAMSIKAQHTVDAVNKSLIVRIALLKQAFVDQARGLALSIKEGAAKKYNLLLTKLTNTDEKVSLVLRLKQVILNHQLARAQALKNAATAEGEILEKKSLITRAAVLLKDKLHLAQLKALTVAALNYAKASVFGSKGTNDMAASQLTKGKKMLEALKGGSAGGKSGGKLSFLTNMKSMLAVIPALCAGVGAAIRGILAALGPVGIAITAISLAIGVIIALMQNSGIKEMFNDLLATIGQTLQPLFDMVKTIMGMLGDLLKSILEPIVAIIQAVLTPVINIIKTILTGAIMPVIKIIATVLTTVIMIPLKIISTILKVVFTLLKPIFSIIEVIGDVISKIFDPLSSIMDTILEPILSVLDPIMEMLDPLIDSIIEPLMSLIKPLVPMLKNVGKVISDLILKPINFVIDALKSVKSFFGFGDEEENKTSTNTQQNNASNIARNSTVVSSSSANMRANTSGMYATNTTTNKGTYITGDTNMTVTINNAQNLNEEQVQRIVTRSMSSVGDEYVNKLKAATR